MKFLDLNLVRYCSPIIGKGKIEMEDYIFKCTRLEGINVTEIFHKAEVACKKVRLAAMNLLIPHKNTDRKC